MHIRIGLESAAGENDRPSRLDGDRFALLSTLTPRISRPSPVINRRAGVESMTRIGGINVVFDHLEQAHARRAMNGDVTRDEGIAALGVEVRHMIDADVSERFGAGKGVVAIGLTPIDGGPATRESFSK